jgi:hypothetical protein
MSETMIDRQIYVCEGIYVAGVVVLGSDWNGVE